MDAPHLYKLPAMNRLPVEVWRRIFSFACLDDGRTGRSLSLVSKYINEASACQRYQSVALAGESQTDRFIKQLMKHCSRERRVLYLFIRDYPRRSGPVLEYGTLCRILVLVAASLRVLSLLIIEEKREFILSPIVLPALEELMVHGNCEAPAVPFVVPGFEFRNLRCIHIQGVFYKCSITSPDEFPSFDLASGRNVVRSITSSSPHLTHISLSTNLAIEWREVLQELEGSDSDPDSTLYRYGLSPNVQRILVRPLVSHGLGDSLEYRAYRTTLAFLSHTAVRDNKARIIIQEEAPIHDLVKNPEEPQRLWLRHIQGEESYWMEAGIPALNRNAAGRAILRDALNAPSG
ncbi:hypothetical protein GLOTRDRAFT_139882 [Gloeophyllum trabeum ATCC 11539]|uniref:F-box domain-containing protein n=1 Tax=Gloeophyllum trabeum (strain ATCC 11539 / FP-39264 / Madison 617) TaxID=670483 RepID=S7RM22_GLOTA|nr:uncharacterized protein GLOTRDRAFT_139882 [Gloeophyllum trabeum ATCC 11539]EPQ53764.1 hypothetical protein GLOTRDRAFT_139882 [Gloeophyllum trabeum ATCC 11539]